MSIRYWGGKGFSDLLRNNYARNLGLIDENNKATDTWKAIATSTNNDYPKVIEGMLRNAYPSVFEIHPNPADATDREIENAFIKSEPLNQRPRMVALFRGLCQEAGLIASQPVAQAREVVSKPIAQKAISKSNNEQKIETLKQKELFLTFDKINPAIKWYNDLGTLMSRLPKSEHQDERPKWTKLERERWLTALQSMLDLLIDVKE